MFEIYSWKNHDDHFLATHDAFLLQVFARPFMAFEDLLDGFSYGLVNEPWPLKLWILKTHDGYSGNYNTFAEDLWRLQSRPNNKDLLDPSNIAFRCYFLPKKIKSI